MTILTMVWAWCVANPEMAIGGALVVAEGITRLTKTEKDDGFVKRLGAGIDFVLSRLPNRVK